MFKLTSHGVLGRAHHLMETSKTARATAIVVTSAAVGLAAGRSKTFRKVPAAGLLGGGLALSYFGFSAIGDGAAAAGATILGYRYGATGRFTKRKSAPEGAVRRGF